MIDLSMQLYAACEHYVLVAGRFRDQTEWMSGVNSLAYALEAFRWKGQMKTLWIIVQVLGN